MSNPLSMFRKYEKILLAVFGVALIIVFTVGSIVSQYVSTSAAQANNPVAVSLKSGDLREADMQSLRAARFHLRNFMRTVNSLAAQNGATPRQSLQIPDTVDESNLVQTAILSSRAESMGIQVSDDAIVQFLERYSQGTIDRGGFARILNNVTQGQMSQNQFFGAMRRELLALRYLSLFQRGMLPPTPMAAWDYFQRLNRRLTFEAVPFDVQDYLSRVDEPTESQIAALYEEAKDRYPIPSSPDPGLKRMKKVAIQYAKADLSDFMPDAKTQITEQQIETYYNENKDEFRNIELPDFGSTDALDLGGDEENSENSENAETGDLNPEDAATTPESSDQSGRPSRTRTLPVAQNQDVDEIGDVIETESDTDVETERVDDEIANDEDPAELDSAEPLADATTDAEAAGSPSLESEVAPADPLAEFTEDDTPDDPLADLPDTAGENVDAESRPEFKPLEEVAEDIRIRLARPIAQKAMDEAVNDVRGRMRTFFQSYRGWELSLDQDTTPAPVAPNMREIAIERGMTFGTVPLVTVYELMKDDPVTGTPMYEISRAYDTSPTYIPFYQRAFDDDLRRFDPKAIRGQVLDTEYVYWKTNEEPERTPDMAEVRDEIVRALKRDQALELAKQDATSAAEQLQKSNQRPSDMFRNDANRTVVTAPSTSWMTSTSIPGMPPQLSTIEGIEYAGDDFMKGVFSLQPGQSGIAVDQPKATVYAVTVISEDSNTDDLRREFMRTFASNPANETLLLAQRENQVYVQDWYQGVEKELGVDWERDPTN